MKIEDELISELIDAIEDLLKDDFRQCKKKIVIPYKKLVAKASRSRNPIFGLSRMSNIGPYKITSEQYKQILDNLKTGRIINAIKDLRGYTGCGLKEAKDAVDEFISQNPTAYVAQI